MGQKNLILRLHPAEAIVPDLVKHSLQSFVNIESITLHLFKTICLEAFF